VAVSPTPPYLVAASVPYRCQGNRGVRLDSFLHLCEESESVDQTEKRNL